MSTKQRQNSLGVILLVALCLSVTGTLAFHRNRFKKCDQSGFCRRNRDRNDLQPITVQNAGFTGKHDTYTSELSETEESTRKLQSKITFYEDGIVNIKVTEASRSDDLAPRFDASPLVMEDSKVVLRSEKANDVGGSDFYSFDLLDGRGTFMFPKSGKDFSFKLVDKDGKEIISAGSLLFENHMKKPEPKPEPEPEKAPEPEHVPEEEEAVVLADEEEGGEKIPEMKEEGEEKKVPEHEKEPEPEKAPEPEPVKTVDGGWEEDFDGGHDSKPNGK